MTYGLLLLVAFVFVVWCRIYLHKVGVRHTNLPRSHLWDNTGYVVVVDVTYDHNYSASQNILRKNNTLGNKLWQGWNLHMYHLVHWTTLKYLLHHREGLVQASFLLSKLSLCLLPSKLHTSASAQADNKYKRSTNLANRAHITKHILLYI